jgi:hypothetical protein
MSEGFIQLYFNSNFIFAALNLLIPGAICILVLFLLTRKEKVSQIKKRWDICRLAFIFSVLVPLVYPGIIMFGGSSFIITPLIFPNFHWLFFLLPFSAIGHGGNNEVFFLSGAVGLLWVLIEYIFYYLAFCLAFRIAKGVKEKRSKSKDYSVFRVGLIGWISILFLETVIIYCLSLLA